MPQGKSETLAILRSLHSKPIDRLLNHVRSMTVQKQQINFFPVCPFMSISCWNSGMKSRHENIQSSITYIFVFYLISDVIVQFLRLKTRDCTNAILVRYTDVTSSCFMTSVYVRLTWRLCLQSWKIDSNSREMRWQHLRHFQTSERKWGRMKYPPQCLVGNFT